MNFKSLSTFALSNQLSDFELILPPLMSSNKLAAHKIIFAANSPTFFTLFTTSNDTKSVELPTPINSVCGQTTALYFENIIKYSYGDQSLASLIALGLNEENAFRFFSAAKVLDFTSSISLISKFIEENNLIKEGQMMESLLESVKFGQEGWIFRLVQRAAQGMRKALADEEMRKKLLLLPIDVTKALLERNDLDVVNEDSVFKFVLDYIRTRETLEEKKKEGALEAKPKDPNTAQNPEAQKKNEKPNQPPPADKKDEKAPPAGVKRLSGPTNLETEAEKRLTNYKLSTEQKNELLNLVRLSFVSHSVLLESVRDPLLSPFKDLLLEAISAKLASYESVAASYSIPLKPRDSYNKNLSLISPTKNTEPVMEPSAPSPPNESFEKNSAFDSNFKAQPKEKKIEFAYSYNFDEQGALYWLGTMGKKQAYKNPYVINMVKVFFSSIYEKCKYDTFVGRTLENCRTQNSKNSFMGLDLGENRSLVPKQYTIRNRDSIEYVMLNWVLEVSNNYNDWFEVDRRVNLTNQDDFNKTKKAEQDALMQKGALTTWNVEPNKVKEVIKKLGEDIRKFKGFRYFRIKQISQNSHGTDNLALSGFELYGTGYGDWLQD